MTTARLDADAAPLRLTLLGGFELRCARGDPIRLPSNKVRLLLALLALTPGRMVSRERLISLLWSDRAEPQGRASLRQALWELRSALCGIQAQALRAEGEMVGLHPTAVAVDVERFERLVADGSIPALEAAAGLYRGELLEGLRVRDPAYEAYLLPERERLRDLALSALGRLLEQEAATAPPHRVVEIAHRLTALDPFHEPAHRALMRLWAREGRSDLALRQYRICKDVLRRELDIGPQPETEQLAEDIRRGRIGPEPAPAPGESPGATPAPAVIPALRAPLMRRATAAAIAASVVALLGAFYLVPLSQYGRPLAPVEPEVAGGRLPTVTFVALESAEGDAGSARTARMLANELMAELSRSGRVSVIDASVETAQAADATRYLLGGAVRDGGDEVRLSVKLVDGGAARPVWSERYPIRLGGLGKSDEIGNGIVSDILAALQAHGTAEQQTRSAEAAAAFVRGWHHYRRYELWADRVALAAFTEAVSLDPNYGRAHAALAALYWRCWLDGCGHGRNLGLTSWAAAWDRAEQHLEHAMASPTPLAHQVASQMLLQQARHQEAIAEAERGVALDPDDGDSLATLAEIRTITGSPFDALTELERVHGTDLQRSPLYPRALGRALFATGRFSEAAAVLERAVALQPEDKAARELLTSAYGHLGRAGEAAASAAALTDLVRRNWRNPSLHYRLQMAEFDSAMQLPGDRSRLLTGLRLAGIPD